MENKENLGCLIKGHHIIEDNYKAGTGFVGECINCLALFYCDREYQHVGQCNWQPYE